MQPINFAPSLSLSETLLALTLSNTVRCARLLLASAQWSWLRATLLLRLLQPRLRLLKVLVSVTRATRAGP